MALTDQGQLFNDIEPLFLRERRNAEARELIFGQLLPFVCVSLASRIGEADFQLVMDIEQRLMRIGREAYISPEEIAILREVAWKASNDERDWDSYTLEPK